MEDKKLTWLDVVMSMPNPFDFDMFVSLMAGNSLPHNFRLYDYGCRVGAVHVYMHKFSLSPSEAYKQYIADNQSAGPPAREPAKIPANELRPCGNCGGGRER